MKVKKYRWLLVLLVALIVGIVGEGIYELNICRKSMKGNHQVADDSVEESFITYSEGIEKNTEGYYAAAEGEIAITIPERYINKLSYHYQSAEDYQVNLKIQTKDIYKNPEVREIKEFNRLNMDTSVVNIQDYVTQIVIKVPKGVTVSEFVILNSWNYNWYRALYIGMFAGLILAIFILKDFIIRRIEIGFLILCLGCGVLFIAVQPLEAITWDEHIHFSNTFDWFKTGTVNWSESEWYIYSRPESFDRAAQLSKEEKQLQAEYLNDHNSQSVDSYEKGSFRLSYIGYFHMALAIKIGQILQLPFTALFIIGKLANLLLYAAVMSFAIRILPVGKKFLVTIGLMPTLLLQATTYTYDAVVIAFICLGTSLIIDEFYHEERKLTIKRVVMILFAFIWGSCPKAVYIPLILIFLMLPNKKFRSIRIAVICKGIVILICLGILASILLPVSEGTVQADSRGGDTDVSRQMAMVLGHPFAYIRILLTDILDSLNNFIFGKESLANLAYAGILPYDTLVGVLCVGVALTEKKQVWQGQKKNYLLLKSSMAILLIGVTVMIWSAMYLSFTVVGATEIAGVQGRYFTPLLLPIYMVFYSSKVEGRWKETSYNTVLLLIILFLAHQSMYEPFFQAFCV